MRPRGSIAAPLLLIAIGVLFLIHAISPSFQIGEIVAQYWPYALIAWGGIGLIEISIRFLAGAPIPVNGISGGGWVLAILICIGGLITFEAHRPDNWWRHAGFQHSVEAFGEEHEYSVNPVEQQAGQRPHIVIESFRGDAKIVGNGGSLLTVTGHKVIRSFESDAADRANEATPVQVSMRGNTIVIQCNQDRAGGKTLVTTNLELAAPKGASIEATGTTGDFDVASLTGDVDLSSANAGVRVQDVEGNVKVDTRASDLIRCDNVHGNVDLRGHGMDVELTKIAGQTTIAGAYTGTVSLRELARPVRVENMRTVFDVQQVPGEIRMDRGSLSIQNVIGPVKLTTRSTDVTVDGFTEGLELTVDKGDVDVRPGRLPLGTMVVHTKSGNIELSLPQTAQFALTATTDHGEIDNEFGDALQERTQGRGARLEGTVGPGPDLNLVTDRGTITVRKATGAPGPGVSSTQASGLAQQARLVSGEK